jgi:hypothetical protein
MASDLIEKGKDSIEREAEGIGEEFCIYFMLSSAGS